jgi:hypothetical protein
MNYRKRLKWFLLYGALVGLFAHDGQSQCTLWNPDPTTCQAYNPTTNPTLDAFLAQAQADYTTIRAATAKMPQPKMTLTGQNMAAAGAYLQISPASYGPYMTTYAQIMKNSAGITHQDVFPWAIVAGTAAEYSHGTIVVPSDCPGGVLLVKNAAVPGGTNPSSRCQMLAYYDQMFAWALANGVQLNIGFPAQSSGATDVHGCNLTAGSVTVAQYEDCMGPLINAFMTRYGSQMTNVQVFLEPVGGARSVNTWNVSQVAAIILNFSAIVKAAVPGTLVGASYTGMSFPDNAQPCGAGNFYDTCFWTDAATGTAAAGLDFLAIDYFTGSCDQSGGYYANELVWFETNYITQSGGKPVIIGQSQPQNWCTIGGSPNEPAAILGCGDNIWETSGLNTSWQTTMVPAWSANGITSASVFFTVFMFNTTTDQTNDNCASGSYTALAMTALSPHDAAGTWSTLGQWPAFSIQGRGGVSGRFTAQ